MSSNTTCAYVHNGLCYSNSDKVNGTLEILWTSLATIFTCTYTILHLNVPEQRQGRDPGWKGDLKWLSWWNSIRWSIVTVFAPEYILAKSIVDFFQARKELCALHASKPETKETWRLTHMLFADMGGFVLEYHKAPEQPTASGAQTPGHTTYHLERQRIGMDDALERSKSEAHVKHDETNRTQDLRLDTANVTVHDEHIIVEPPNLKLDAVNATTHDEKFTVKPLDLDPELGAANAKEKMKEPLPDLFHLSAETLRQAVERGLLATTIVDVDQINDRSKSSLFAKILTLGQAMYFLLSFFVRWGNGLLITPLEVGVLAFVFTAAITYAFVLYKPKDVQTTTTLQRYDFELPAAFNALGWRFINDAYVPPSWKAGGSIPNYLQPGPGYLLLWLLIIPTGAIHLAGWNLSFPAKVDLWLWRAAALGSTAVVPVFVFGGMAGSGFLWDRFFRNLWEPTFILVYVISRLVIMVEMFRCLFYLEPEAFASTWTVNVPHLG